MQTFILKSKEISIKLRGFPSLNMAVFMYVHRNIGLFVLKAQISKKYIYLIQDQLDVHCILYFFRR
jgi:hypothetical protein